MTCLDHACADCGHEWFDNNPSHTCPKCGSTNTVQVWDEREHDEPKGDYL